MTKLMVPGRPETAQKHVGHRLRLLRLALGYRHIQPFAAAIGEDRSLISKMERGDRAVTQNVLLSIYGRFDVTSDWVLFGKRRALGDLAEKIDGFDRETEINSKTRDTPERKQ